MNSSNNFEFEWITDWDTIYSEEFQKQWLNWVETALNSHVFFHPDLCMAWIKTYRPIRDLKPLFCIAKMGGTTIFLPLVLWKQNWKNAFQNLIVPVGYSDFDYHDPLILSTESLEKTANLFFNELLENLQEKYVFDLIHINGILIKVKNSSISLEKDIAPYAEIQKFQTSDDFLNSLKSKLRGDIRRQIRRLSEIENLHLINYQGKQLSTGTLDVFLSSHIKRWPNAYKAPLFHKNIIEAGLKNGIVHFSELKVGTETISWHLGFQFNKTFFYYMPTVDEKWQKFSPGKIHLFKLVEEAINNKLEIFDHLRGEENYKTGWTNNIQNLYQVNLESSKVTAKIKSKMIQLKKN